MYVYDVSGREVGHYTSAADDAFRIFSHEVLYSFLLLRTVFVNIMLLRRSHNKRWWQCGTPISSKLFQKESSGESRLSIVN